MTYPEKHIALVCNPTLDNEKALRSADRVVRILQQKGVAFSIFTKYWPKEFEQFTDVWIFGGDGTLNQFINQNPEIKLPLSCFKAGSGNDFHWMIYGEITLEDQVDKILNGDTIQVDAGICNGHYFLNGVGIGFDGAIVKDLIGKKKLGGKASYLVTVLKNIFTYKEKSFHIELPDLLISDECLMISIANGRRFGGGFMVTPKASLTDGLLDISIVGKIPSIKRMRYLPYIEKGEHLDLPFIRYYMKDKITIRTSTEIQAHLDGEFYSSDRFEIFCLAKKFLFSV
jgi:diacylglycerol kinase (ATP)